LDKEIGEFTQAVLVLRAETQALTLNAEHIETIEAIAAEVRARVDRIEDNQQEQRAIFQLLDVHVTLSYDNNERWADVTCVLGTIRCAAVSPTS
jgi:hypothetical protein